MNKIKNEILKKIYLIMHNSVNLLALMVLIPIMFANMYFLPKVIPMPEKLEYGLNTVIPVVLSVIIFMIIRWISYNKRIKTTPLLIIAITINIIISIVFVLKSRLPLVIDQGDVFGIAKEIYNNNFTGKYIEYFMIYPHQSGLIGYEELFFRIVGKANILGLQMLNVIYNALTIFMLYKITNIIFKNEKVNKAVIVFSVIYVNLIQLTTFVYGDLIGLPFVLIAVYYAIKFVKKLEKKENNVNKKILYLFILITFLAFATFIRNNYIMFAIAIASYLFLSVFKYYIDNNSYKKTKQNIDENAKLKQNIKEKIKLILKIVLVIIYAIVVLVIPTKMVKKYYEQYTKEPLNRAMPALLFMYMGADMTWSEPGWWNGRTLELYYDKYNKDIEKINKEVPAEYIKKVKEHFESPKKFMEFYGRKTISMWTENTHMGLNSNLMPYYHDYLKQDEKDELEKRIRNDRLLNSLHFGKLLEFNYQYNKALSIILYAGVVIFAIRNLKYKNKEVTLILIIFLGGLLFHTIWEAKSRYVLPYVVMMIPLGVNIVLLPEMVGRALKQKEENELDKVNKLNLNKKKN